MQNSRGFTGDPPTQATIELNCIVYAVFGVTLGNRQSKQSENQIFAVLSAVQPFLSGSI